MKVVEILMRRDGLSKEEALNCIENFRELAEDLIAEGDFDGVEEALMSDLGLEPDYLPEILDLY